MCMLVRTSDGSNTSIDLIVEFVDNLYEEKRFVVAFVTIQASEVPLPIME